MKQVNWRKYGQVLYKVLAGLTCVYAAWIVLRIVTQVFVFASFSIPTASMKPVLCPGDYVLVNKFLKGARIFDLEDAVEHRPLKIKRLPGLDKFRRGEVLVFNFPYPERWDSIGFDVMLYYVKRCIAMPGDTVEIRNARYRVRGIHDELGNVDSQRSLAAMLATDRGVEEMIHRNSYNAFPGDSALGWNIKEFGPLYVPACGDSIRMDSLHFKLYRNLIEWEQRGKLVCNDGHFYLNSEEIKGYRFKINYYFMGGDNCFDSQDSRYWGLLPECYIVGKVVRIWKSENRFTGKLNWDRIWKKVE